jgi:hypothetical protein
MSRPHARGYRRWTLLTCLAAMLLQPFAASSQTASGSAAAATAELGVELPTLGGATWGMVQRNYVNPRTMQDIRDNLHATYVRTGWIPDRLHAEKIRWYREDSGMDIICGSGLRLMVILPSPRKDGVKVGQDLVDNVREFFARYTAREPGCIRYAEVANEADLPANAFAGVKDYASYYQQVAPVVASFGIETITSGVSGEDRAWTSALAAILDAATPGAPPGGYGFHPYGVAPSRMGDAVLAIRQSAGAPNGTLPKVYVTEIGQANARDLYQTIVNLAHVTPTITIYEYAAAPDEDPQYGLRDNPALYHAVQSAWQYLHSGP